jgi:uncharacterized membrane protein YciS (DUF1049 family)
LHLVASLLHLLPVALDGESAGQSSTGLAVISVVSMVFGWLLIAGLWWFVFRDKARARRGERDRSE